MFIRHKYKKTAGKHPQFLGKIAEVYPQNIAHGTDSFVFHLNNQAYTNCNFSANSLFLFK